MGSPTSARRCRSSPGIRERVRYPFEEQHETDEGWAKLNRHYWLRDYRGFLEFFFGRMFTEPHSTKQIEDCIGWGLETDPETMVDITRGLAPPEDFRETLRTGALSGDGHPRRPRTRSARTRAGRRSRT